MITAPRFTTNTFGQILFALGWIFLCGAVVGLLSGSLWASVDALRKFSTGYQPPPYIAATIAQQFQDGTLLGLVEDLIDWYNNTFFYAARFGSGIGLIAGLVFSWGKIKTLQPSARIVGGIVSGAFLGGRMILMITSDPRYCLAAAAIGAILCSAYLFCEGRSRLAPLPRIGLGNP